MQVSKAQDNLTKKQVDSARSCASSDWILALSEKKVTVVCMKWSRISNVIMRGLHRPRSYCNGVIRKDLYLLSGFEWLSSSIEWRSSARPGRGTYGSIFWSFYQPRSGIVLEWLTAFSSWGPFTHDFSLTTQTNSKLCSKSVQPVQTVLLSAFLPRLVFVLLVTYIYMYTVQ